MFRTTRRPHPAAAILAAALLAGLGGCATPARLARQSNEALAQGDLSKAYDRALRAIEKDPQNAAAREAYDAASQRVATDYQNRVLATAAGDTLSAAELALRFRDFRAEVARHGSPLASAPAYEAAEPKLFDAAARTHFRLGRGHLQAKHPRLAFREFEACLRFDPAYPGAEKREAQAWSAAVARVALLPFIDGVGVRGLSADVLQTVQAQVSNRVSTDFNFTRLVPPDSVAAKVSMAQMRDLSREDACAIGLVLGAQLVVTGRITGIHSNDSTREPMLTVYHRVETKDDQGNTVVKWRDRPMHLVTHDRDVLVRWAFDVIDPRTGAVVKHVERESHAGARVAWTDFRPDDDFDHYSLMPPDERSAHPDRGRELDAMWKERMGTWTLAEFLKASHAAHDRDRYSSRYRDEFRGDTRQHPVWLRELPDEGDLAFVALGDAWRPVVDALRELDRVE